MDEIEVPLEKVQEDIHHEAAHAQSKWVAGVALSSALLAVLAAITALLAGHHANEAMIEQMKASDHWSHYQAKSIKASILAAKMELGHVSSAKDQEKLVEYQAEQKELSEQANEKQHASEHHLVLHNVYARGVTMFQVAIAIAAISVLTRRRRFWLVALGFGLVGAAFLLQGVLLR